MIKDVIIAGLEGGGNFAYRQLTALIRQNERESRSPISDHPAALQACLFLQPLGLGNLQLICLYNPG